MELARAIGKSGRFHRRAPARAVEVINLAGLSHAAETEQRDIRRVSRIRKDRGYPSRLFLEAQEILNGPKWFGIEVA
jgi:hypothetical protein